MTLGLITEPAPDWFERGVPGFRILVEELTRKSPDRQALRGKHARQVFLKQSGEPSGSRWCIKHCPAQSRKLPEGHGSKPAALGGPGESADEDRPGQPASCKE